MEFHGIACSCYQTLGQSRVSQGIEADRRMYQKPGHSPLSVHTKWPLMPRTAVHFHKITRKGISPCSSVLSSSLSPLLSTEDADTQVLNKKVTETLPSDLPNPGLRPARPLRFPSFSQPSLLLVLSRSSSLLPRSFLQAGT